MTLPKVSQKTLLLINVHSMCAMSAHFSIIDVAYDLKIIVPSFALHVSANLSFLHGQAKIQLFRSRNIQMD